ncbi:hypothetical protein [Nostoc sp.]|uniref:hypothetical protein n=1 Tax=Nostoc sp. TaxID=1180 RepID=UPI0035945CD1
MAIKQFFSRLSSSSLSLVGLATLLLLSWGTLAPVGTLTWWLNLETEELNLDKDKPPNGLLPDDRSSADNSEQQCYIVFLPGVGNTGGGNLPAGETEFLQRLTTTHPDCVAVDDVFPYSIGQQTLVEDNPLAGVWRAAEQDEGVVGQVFINIRNFWQMALSADDRYGPTYNWAIAVETIERMQAKLPIRDRDRPLKLILIGTSGGAQVAVGTTPYLNRWLNAEITPILIGGFFEGTEGFAAAEQIYHLRGDRDWIEGVAAVVFPARWRWTVGSPFNQARREGKFVDQISGPHEHQGDEGYFGETQVQGQQSYLDLTLQEVKQLPVWQSTTVNKTSIRLTMQSENRHKALAHHQ